MNVYGTITELKCVLSEVLLLSDAGATKCCMLNLSNKWCYSFIALALCLYIFLIFTPSLINLFFRMSIFRAKDGAKLLMKPSTQRPPTSAFCN